MRTLNINVYLYLKNICVNNSSGVDDISPKILKLKSPNNFCLLNLSYK